jgi:hypothetical protein
VEGDGKEILAQCNGNAHIRGYAIFRALGLGRAAL